MPRKYQRKPGARPYLTTYTEDDLKKAIIHLAMGKGSLRKAAKEFNVPISTLQRNFKEPKNKKKTGGQPCLNEETEKELSHLISILIDWGIPINSFDIRCMVKVYLDKSGRVDGRFKENMPGIDWVKTFKRRHNISRLTVTNRRSNLNKEKMKEYFENLSLVLEGIPPNRIYAYDEINIIYKSDGDTLITRRNHGDMLERKRDTSKECVSVMFAGNAAGEYSPPMVVFQGKELSPKWTEGGPTNAVYDVSDSGRFDSRTFENWFFNVFLKTSQSKGIKVLIGNNLGSYFTLAVIKATLENDVRLITLPPNSCQLCQPLHFSILKDLEESWGKSLGPWTTKKKDISSLLSSLIDTVSCENLRNSFFLTGIYPFDKKQIFRQIPVLCKSRGIKNELEVSRGSHFGQEDEASLNKVNQNIKKEDYV